MNIDFGTLRNPARRTGCRVQPFPWLKRLSAAALAFAVPAALLLGGCTLSLTEKEIYIKLIAKSSESDFWKTVFAGAQAAAAEYNVEVVCISPLEEDDYETQNRQIVRSVEQGYDALILSACDFDKTAPYVENAMDSGVTVVSIDSPVNVKRDMTRIGTDNVEAGRTAARALFNQAGSAPVIAGVINFEENSGNGVQREEGFLEEAAALGIQVAEIRYSFSNAESPRDQTLAMLEEHPEINSIVTFNEWTTIGVGDAVKKLDAAERTTVVGFDTNIQSIEDLENGALDALIVQNPFAMGYLGVSKALAQVRKKEPVEEIDTGTNVITKENMYNPENQKLVFPFSS